MAIATNIVDALERKQWEPVHLVVALLDRGVRVNVKTVERWVSGETEPRASMLGAVADALGMTVDRLLEEKCEVGSEK